jgi:hypothetical protein
VATFSGRLKQGFVPTSDYRLHRLLLDNGVQNALWRTDAVDPYRDIRGRRDLGYGFMGSNGALVEEADASVMVTLAAADRDAAHGLSLWNLETAQVEHVPLPGLRYDLVSGSKGAWNIEAMALAYLPWMRKVLVFGYLPDLETPMAQLVTVPKDPRVGAGYSIAEPLALKLHPTAKKQRFTHLYGKLQAVPALKCVVYLPLEGPAKAFRPA